MKPVCSVCGNKTSIWTRTRISDGFLCSKCTKQCSEHIDNIKNFYTEEIKQHLAYRKENFNSERFKNFSATMTFGKYEILKIDEVHKLWLLKTDKPFHNDNPDIFSFSQIINAKMILKKECINKFENFNGKKSRIPKKLRRKKNRTPVYGYWFYVVININHPMFSEISMRINKYIINEKNKSSYDDALQTTKKIVKALNELSKK